MWNVLEYSTEKSPLADDGYVNIKLRGNDGNNLIFEGMTYTQRTYDYFDEIQEGEVYTRCYCFYEVPKGCREYLLEFGIHDNNIEGLKNIEGSYLRVR